MADNMKSMSYKIPNTDNKYYVSNASDIIPNIQYTKNIDMDEEGYLRLSPPFPKLISSTEIADFSTLIDAIKLENRLYKLITSSKIYDLSYSGNSLLPVLDAGAPSGGYSARFAPWKYGSYKNRAYINLASDIYSYEHSHNISPVVERWTKENTDSINYAETFINRNTLVGASGNSVQQYKTTDMDATTPPSTNSGQTLTIPDNFGIRGLVYSNYRMGVITKAESGSGSSAYFFTWDGSTADAQQGFPVGAEIIIDCVAYKNSWVLVTSVGQVLFFNGNGFDVLGNLPIYYQNADWFHYDFSLDHGKNMLVDGDVIYFNIGTVLNQSDDKNRSGLMKGFYSGVWCYDPEMKGIYHRYGLSHSQLNLEELTPSSGIYTSTGHLIETGDRVFAYSYGTFFAIKINANTFKLADSYDLAILGTATATAPTTYLTWIKRTDWSQLSFDFSNLGAVKKFEDKFSLAYNGFSPMFVGMGGNTKTLTYENITSVKADAFDNIGSICYSKIKSENYEDVWESIALKYKQLSEGDKIIIKYKTSNSYKQIGIGLAGDETPARYLTWVDSTSFTISNSYCNLTEVEVGDEVEFFQGAGAGSTAHVVSKTLVAGTWTVVIDEAIRGAVAGNKATALFDSFKKLGTITKTNNGNLKNQTRFSLNKHSKWIQVKLELRGNNIGVEELIINNKTIKPIV